MSDINKLTNTPPLFFDSRVEFHSWLASKGPAAYVFIPRIGYPAMSRVHYSGCHHVRGWTDGASIRFCSESLEVLLNAATVRSYFPIRGEPSVCNKCEEEFPGLHARAAILFQRQPSSPLEEYEKRLADAHVPLGPEGETEGWRTTRYRIGQVVLRERLIKIRRCCEVTGLEVESLLVASHIKPWAVSNNAERLDLENAFLLAANFDALFDRHLVTFDDDGRMLFSSSISDTALRCLGVARSSKLRLSRSLTDRQKQFLISHRDICLGDLAF